MVEVRNVFRVCPSAWGRWTFRGQMVFEWMYANFQPPLGEVAAWNAAFVAACEVSGLDVEFEARDG